MKKFYTLFLALIIISTMEAQNLIPYTYTDGSQTLQGYITSNADQNLPGVLILPAWMGIDEEARQTALNLQEKGYIAFIADIYGVGNVPNNYEESANISSHYKTNYTLYQHRIDLALQVLKKQVHRPENVAVIGYCFGGTGAIEVMRAGLDVKGTVCIHGGLAKDSTRTNEKINTKVLVIHPADDDYVSQKDFDNLIQELKDGNADWQLNAYAHSKHTFTDPKSMDYNPLMAKRAWRDIVIFLDEVLQ
ncbi:MAG: dienelactone hydrolase family protein [Chitinophagales bacterium]|nr:dienelactone hydrolase family protein [Chitinophagales bacterium]